MKRLATVISSLVSVFLISAAQAYPFIEFLEPKKSGVRSYRDVAGRMIPSASACEHILLDAERDLKRPLTPEEITRNLKSILDFTGDSLVFPQNDRSASKTSL